MPWPACGASLVGEAIWTRYQRWPVFAKFFDNRGPIPHHMHQDAAQAALVGREAKPEGYYFPPQMNARGNDFPFTFFGLAPGTTKADVRRCLERWHTGDNGILDLAQASRLEVGTGWLIPPRMLHAPGSLCTYEPQWASDVLAMYQSVVDGQAIPWDLLVQDVPPAHHHDLDYLVDQLDWDANLDPAVQGDAPAPPARGVGRQRLRRSVGRLRAHRRRQPVLREGTHGRARRHLHDPATTARGDSCACRARARSTASRSRARRSSGSAT